MAYVDAIHPNRRLGTLGAVAALHLALGYALVTGLVATGVIKHDQPPLVATFTRQPAPPPSPTPGATHSHFPRQMPSPVPMIAVPTIDPTFIPTASGISDGSLVDARFPASGMPTARPSFAPRPPRPIGQGGRWVTPDDYPTSDLRLGHAGITDVILAISANGRVINCAVHQSSGWPSLDQTACARLLQRARFAPATDSFGTLVAGRYSTRIRWQVPD